jgi:predicted  nucleic acid-binding Zn-ribbon protein
MFNCERCGSSFSPIRAAILEYCPRCRARDGVAVPLIFSLFEEPPRKDKEPGLAPERGSHDDKGRGD